MCARAPPCGMLRVIAEGSIPTWRPRHHGHRLVLPRGVSRGASPARFDRRAGETSGCFALPAHPVTGRPHPDGCHCNDLVGHDHRARRGADLRRRRPRPPPARAVDEGVRDRAHRLRRAGRPLRPVGVGGVGQPVRRRVLRRLADRVLPLDRQPVRLPADHGQLQGATGVPADRPAGRDHPGHHHARLLHPGRCCGDQPVRVGVLPLRRVPDLHGRQAVQERQHRGRRISREPVPGLGRAGLPGRLGVGRHQAAHPDRRQAAADADVHRHRGARHDRPALRAGLDPGDLRPDSGALPGADREHLRADGPTPAVLPDRRPAQAPGLPVLRARCPAGLHRGQADLARPAREQPAVHQRRRAGQPSPTSRSSSRCGRSC